MLSRYVLSIGDVVTRTGLAEPTLRMWERRHGFPAPGRTESGHRRYSEEQVGLIEQVLVLRDAGLSLPAAIARAQTPPDPGSISLFSALRDLRPELHARAVRKPLLLALSHAIEDEALARGEARVMFGCFQRESFYRGSQSRWRELAATVRTAAVFADFKQISHPTSGPVEVPIGRLQQIAREWAIVLYGGRSSICLVGRELASSNVDAQGGTRWFEMLWTVEPEAVKALSRLCVAATGEHLPELAAEVEEALEVEPAVVPGELVRLTTDIVNRTLAELS